ncbi:ribose 5-phosphate isomerase [Candidatus Blochmanniella pennsylvanica str. BPEN]|uniref:Ribose-5-phosphate isomerase A n=1 Tax=Blochmanniella pennsylvanica (strain BPEN) TaxID=291272 RepID=RPIA_BLOPB|nr:ribose-5-phosphate isomerase RpiA [Candidatus Blochmannia pennsylvanicus]Q493E8.1 RecName: Full=Ribose-5-phosphate isomerase A; AltName: Full=Phosphoriboisomerase A; Short=PRI [Candidatus Blochmannia pennsylvanicus str. BPEN]AAZ40894.1 ribose 5-phosphate isomerase [Candidatus Blochmannia pennsylvanicus str. BPEN]UOY04122.1 ribose-5-phosphate isomerase RpiA [Candidatus Blochmannia pennsylvanicus]
MVQNKLKKSVGWAALKYVQSSRIIGVGTGSTVTYFIEALNSIKEKIEGVVSSSNYSSNQLKKIGIPLCNLNSLHELDVYVDSADEIDSHMQMIKGKGGALTKEKIIAAAAKKFICIVDSSKQVNILGRGPLPIEVIPMARSLVARELVRLGGLPEYRHNVITDNGNNILDVYNMKIVNASLLETKINNIPGVVSVGIFAKRRADIVLIGTREGIKIIE